MRRPRHLSPEERALWDRVTAQAKPLDTKPESPELEQKPSTSKKTPDLKPLKFRVGQQASTGRPNDILPDVSQRLTRAPVQMDPKSYGRMTKGKLKPEARLDLHGMTLAEAHPELVSFILGSQAMGRRLVLVITGKGKHKDEGGPIPTRFGVLRHQVPQWLALPPLAQAILQVTPAHLKHGGTGAYYVYLRRNR